MKKFFPYFLVVLWLIFIVISVCAGIFEFQEMLAYDFLLRHRPTQQVNPEIVIIEISDDTLKGLGRWPLPRDYHADLIEILSKNGCRSIVFDILFSEPSGADVRLELAMKESGRVYLPFAFRLENKRGEAVAQEVLGGVTDTLKSAVYGVGHINIFVDNDGKSRRLPLWVKRNDQSWPALGFLAAAHYLGKEPASIAVPFDLRTGIWVNYPGAWLKTFRHFSYLDIIQSAAAAKKGEVPRLELSLFRNKICFIGLTAAGTSDFRANPVDPVYPMVGTQASICNSILQGAYIRRLGNFLRVLINFMLFFIGLWLALKLAPLVAFACSFLLAAGYIFTAQVLFNIRGVFYDIFFPVSSLIFVYSGVLLVKFFREVQARRLMEKELEIAAQIQRNFLPADLGDLGELKLRLFLQPAKFVGGDFYDVILLDEHRFGIFIADVSGKGISAALIMAKAISLLRILARDALDPGKLLSVLSSHLKSDLDSRFITGQYLIIDLRDYSFIGASAGHPPLIFLSRGSGRIEELIPASGPPLGLVDNFSYTVVKGQFLPGDKIFMYTDGWIEARDSQGKEFGALRLKEVLSRLTDQGIDNLLAALKQAYEAHRARALQHDDLTAVILERK
jgi:CHASE2 domain-containing sensor protein